MRFFRVFTVLFSPSSTSPNLDTAFKSELRVVRRSDRFWSGLSTDLAIEQALMRSIKSIWGLTQGRGLAETQRAQWLLSINIHEQI
jgi:hypothetical protein